MDVDELRELPLFADLSDDGLRRLAACVAVVRAEPGRVLARHDDPGAGMFVIQEGTAAVELRSGSVEIGPGDFFGELAVLVPGAGRVARVRATTEVRCISVPRDDMLAVIESEPTLAVRMLRELARRLVEARSS